MGKENARNGKATMDDYGELQSQQPTLEGNKALSQYSTLTSNPKHERCVHFHSHYKPQIYFNNMGALVSPQIAAPNSVSGISKAARECLMVF